MKKLKLLTGILLIGALLLTVGASIEALELKDGETLIDDNEKEIDITDIGTVISLEPAVTEMFYMIGQFDKLVAVAQSTSSANWPKKTDNLKNVGTIRNVNIEEIINIDPDLIIGSDMSQSGLEQAEELGFRTAYVSPDNIDEILHNMLVFGEILGDLGAAERKVIELKELLDKAENNINVENPKKVIMLYSTNPPKAFGEDTLSGEVLERAGLNNIIETADNQTVSFEEILNADPDYIFLAMRAKGAVEELKDNSNWQELQAVKNNNIIVPPTEHILRKTPRLIYGVSEINEKIYSAQE